MTNMGARVARMFKNFNLENRALKEISKEKPAVAPRYPTSVTSSPSPDEVDAIHQKNDPLLSLLKTVYVESTDPEAAKQVTEEKEQERRPLKYHIPISTYGMDDITDVPKGKVSIVEALQLLNNHKREPVKWTAEKIAQEFSLDPKDSTNLIQYFMPFEVKILPPKNPAPKQIKDK